MKKLLLLILLATTSAVWSYQSVGTDTTVDIMTWNIREFPRSGTATITEVAKIIQDLKVDLIAVQEIESVSSFEQVLAQTPGWKGLLSSHTYNDGSYDKVGIFYDETKITIDSHRLILTYDSYNLPRPPLEITLTAREGEHRFDFKLIILHLKAYGDETSANRRREALRQLKSYLDDEVRLREEKDFIVVGDFNDELHDPAGSNVFAPFLADTSRYTFLTKPLAGIDGSYIFWPTPSLIDHFLITADARDEYGLYGQTNVVYLDRENDNYPDIVSDHRPVLAKFSFIEGTMDDSVKSIARIHQEFALFKGKSVTVRGVITLGVRVLNPEYTMAYIQDESQAGINIFKTKEIIADLQRQAYVELTGLVDEYNGLHELKYQAHKLLGTDYPLPEPKLVTTASLADLTDQGLYVQVSGRIESMQLDANSMLFVNDGSGPGKVFFDKDANLQLPAWQIGEQVQFNGVKSVYLNEGELLVAYQDHLMAIPAEPRSLPENHQLLANYPNPFNNMTRIVFRLPHAEKMVRIRIFDYLGAELNRYDWMQPQAGTYEFDWKPNALPSGVYFCQLQGGDWQRSIKMMLLK